MGNSAFHEGRGAGKSATPGGRIIVSEKNSYGKKKVYGKNSWDKRKVANQTCFVETWGKLPLSGGSAGTAHATRSGQAVHFFSQGVFLSGPDYYRLVSLRGVGNGLVWLFSIPVYSL